MLDLSLLGPPVAGERLLDPGGRVLEEGQPAQHARQQRRAPGLAELQGRSGIAGDEDVLDRDLLGSVLVHHPPDALEDPPQSLPEVPLPRHDAPAREMHGALAVGVDDAEAGDAGAGVDAEDAGQASFARISSGISALE